MRPGAAATERERPASPALHSKRVTVEVSSSTGSRSSSRSWSWPRVGASDEEQRLGELREPIDLLGRSLQRRSQLRLVLAVPERELELRAQERERRPQLVAGVRDEGALAEQRSLEPGEHRVERVSEPLDLVPRPRHGQPLARPLGRDRRRPAPHRLDRSEREPCEDVARQGRQQERDRAGDQELVAQASQRLRAVLAGDPDDEHEALPAPRDVGGEDARRLVEARHRAAVREELAGQRPPHLVGTEHGCAAERRGRVQHAPAPGEDLRVALPRLDEAAAVLRLEWRARPADEHREVVGAQPQLPVEGERQVRAQADVEDRAREDEHGGHRDGERSRHAQADRQPAQALLSRRSR